MISRFSFSLIFAFYFSVSFHVIYGQVLNYETKVIIDNNGKKTTERTVLIQINNKDENWLSHVELKHNPSQEISCKYAYILNKEGNIVRKLKKKELITRSDLSYQTFYQDNLITEFDLYWNQYPYKIEYSYTIEENEYLYIAWWTPLFFKNVITMKSSLEVSLPADFKVGVSDPNVMFYQESAEDGRKILSWSSNICNKQRNESYSPATDKLIPVVKLVPKDFIYGVEGKTDSWSSFGGWVDKLNYGNDQLPLKEQWIIEKLVDGINDKSEVIKTIYHSLQDQTKYVNVSIDVGGLKSYPASYVCENKYGDCKALTTYMKAALKSVGIESFFTIVKAGANNIEIDTNFPSQQFNHVILMVPVRNDTIWLENTSSALPFNYLGTFTQNRYALVINGGKSKLVKTPELSAGDVLLERTYCFQTTKSNEVRADIDVIIRGESFENFRHFITEKDEERQIKEINRHQGIKGFNVESWNAVGFNRDSTFLHLNIAGMSSSILREIGGFCVINPLRIKLPDFTPPGERELDVLISLPINKLDKSVYDLESFAEKEIQVPEGITIENGYGQYRAFFQKTGNELTAVEEFVLYSGTVPIDDYADFYGFIDSIKKYKKKTAILIN